MKKKEKMKVEFKKYGENGEFSSRFTVSRSASLVRRYYREMMNEHEQREMKVKRFDRRRER